MYRDHRVVAFIPFGRKRTASILLNYLRLHRRVVDEVMFWMNTDDDQVGDVEWAHKMAAADPGFVKLYNFPGEASDRIRPKQMNTGRFYRYTQAPDTIYIRFDDDIAYLDDRYFTNLLDFRLAHPEYLLVFGNIWNNAITSWLHQQIGNVGLDHGIVERAYCMDPVGWQSPVFAEHLHRVLLGHIAMETTSSLFFDHHDLLDARRFSISNFAFFGSDCAKWGGQTGERDEEIFLTEGYPRSHGRLNTICGSALVSHYSFFPQRPHLDKTDILDQYREISERRLSSAYYELLGAAETA